MITRKLFCSALGGVIAGAAGLAASVVGFSLLVVVPGLISLAGGFIAAAWWLIQKHPMFGNRDDSARKNIFYMIASAIMANTLFAIFWASQPAAWPIWFLMIAVLVVVEWQAAKGHDYAHKKGLIGNKGKGKTPGTELDTTGNTETSPEVAAAPTVQEILDATDPENFGPGFTVADGLDHVLPNFKKVMSRISLGHLNVPGFEQVFDTAGEHIGNRFLVRVPASMLKADGKDALNAGHCEPIAAAISELAEKTAIRRQQHLPPHMRQLPPRLDASRVAVTKDMNAAACYYVTVVEEDVMARIFPYPNDDVTPKSIKEPAPVGYTIDGQLFRRPLNQHGSEVGQSTSGKSSLIHVELAYTTLCTDEEDWICGVEKLYDLVGPWLECYVGTDEEVPFGWIMAGPEDSARMIAVAMGLARARQSLPLNERRGLKTIIVWLDEAYFTLTNKYGYAMYEGQLLDASTLTAVGTKGAASGGVYFRLASQRGTQGNWGKAGGEIQSNLKDNTVFKSKEQAELGRAFNDWKLPMPKRAGQCWMDPGTGESLQNLKIMYIQTDDPDKPVLHNGPKISDVSWSRRVIPKGLDQKSLELIDPIYHKRRRRAEDIIAYVRRGKSDLEDKVYEGAEAQPPQHTPAPTTTATATVPAPASSPALDTSSMSPQERKLYDAVMADIAKTDAELGITKQLPAAEQPRPALFGVPNTPTSPQPTTHRARVKAVVSESATPMGRADILAALNEQYGDKAPNPQQVTNLLTELVRAGELLKPDDNQYVPA